MTSSAHDHRHAGEQDPVEQAQLELDRAGELHPLAAVEQAQNGQHREREAERPAAQPAGQGVALELAREVGVGRAHAPQQLDDLGLRLQARLG